jgi:phosphatidylglycerophosphate synthase
MSHVIDLPYRLGAQGKADGAPILVLLDAPGPMRSGTPLLGLTMARRAALAARRAGYGKTIVLGAAPGEPDADIQDADVEVVRDWESVPRQVWGRVVVAPAQAVAETAWLAAAATVTLPVGGWTALPGRLLILGAQAPHAALAAGSLDELERGLVAQLGAPAACPPGLDVLVLRDAGDLPQARRRLLGALAKDSDGFMARHVERPISIAMSRWLAETPITPNQITVISGAIGVAAAPFFLSAAPLWQTIGALLFLAHSIIDGCDGELARLKFQESRWGGVLDFWADNVVHLAIFSCMAVGWADATDSAWPLVLGVTAILGAGGSAGFVHWRTMRGKSGEGPLFTGVSIAGVSTGPRPSVRGEALARLLDGAGGRDFVYLVLALAMFGKSSWFMVLAGFGAPTYLLLLLVLALREGSAPASQVKATVAPAAPLET